VLMLVHQMDERLSVHVLIKTEYAFRILPTNNDCALFNFCKLSGKDQKLNPYAKRMLGFSGLSSYLLFNYFLHAN